MEIKCLYNCIHHFSSQQTTADRTQSALHVASKAGHPDIVAWLLDNGANIDQKTVVGETPLHLAAANKRVDVIKLLLDRRADVNAVNQV